MDLPTRKKGSNLKKGSLPLKNGQEVNGNMPSAPNVNNACRSRKKREFLKHKDQNTVGTGDNIGSYLPLQGQRLFSTMSDPAVCGYPLSLGYPYDHITVPLGYSIYPQHPPCTNQVPLVHSSRKARHTKNHDKTTHLKDTFQTVDEYTSLPPENFQDIESDHQRRFSDPGLANNTESDVDSQSDEVSSASCYGDSQIHCQIEMLAQENKRLAKELKDTQTELQELKGEVAALVQVQTSYGPGFATELVREVHEATKLREETLLAKLRAYSENISQSKIPQADVAVENGLKEDLSVRLAALEAQIKEMLGHNSTQEKNKEELLETKKQNALLQQELKTAEEAKNAAEANVTKYERLVNMLSKKLPNGLTLEDKGTLATVCSLDTSESLSSSLGSGSLHSPQVTMSGPVTDL